MQRHDVVLTSCARWGGTNNDWTNATYETPEKPPWNYLFACVEVLRPSQPNGVMSSAVSLPNHTFTGQTQSSKRLTSIVHILSPESDNCPSWIRGRERMTVENISWSISMKECCRPRRGLNPQPPGLQSDGVSNWATEAGTLELSVGWGGEVVCVWVGGGRWIWIARTSFLI